MGIEYVFLTTNGALATKEKVRELMAAGLDSLKFSFNYADGKQIKEVAGVSERNFEKIIQNIKGAREVKDEGGYSCGIYASSIMLDGEQGDKMALAVDRILPYVDEHYWLPLFSFGGQTDFGKPVRGNPGRLDNMREPLPCWSVFSEGHVTSAGDISLCCFDSHKRWVVGNLATSTFMQAWNCQEAQELRAAHLRKDVTGTSCEHCAVGG
jgi:radical SAM protein with 4Fe4S-binding SPASM domain